MGLERSKRVGGKMHLEAKGRQYVRFARSVRAVQARYLEQTPPRRCARKADEVDVTTMCVVCRNGIHCLKTDGLLVFIIENVFAMENATIINVLRSDLNRRGRKLFASHAAQTAKQSVYAYAGVRAAASASSMRSMTTKLSAVKLRSLSWGVWKSRHVFGSNPSY